MWRSICVFILLPTLTLAQAQSVASAPQSGPSRQVTAMSAPIYKGYTYHTQIRRGTTEKAVLALDLRVTGLPSSATTAASVISLRLDLHGEDGMNVQDLKYPKSRKHSFAFQTQPIPVAVNHSVRFKLRADPNAALGPHLLKGKLTFQTVSDRGISPPQTIDVQIPVTVVAHDAKVRRAPWTYAETSKREWITLILFSPVLVALVIVAIPLMVICGVATGRAGCE